MEETVTTKTPNRSRRGGVEPVFTRRQLLKAETMAVPRDVLSAVLEEGQLYTKGQAQGLAETFLKRKVN